MINFTPGPSQIYFTVPDHVKRAFRDGVPSLSHRSKDFEMIFGNTVESLRQLLNIPAGFHIFFAGSATEIWERCLQNLVAEKSAHLVNGAFSKRFFEIAGQLNKHPEKIEIPFGQGFDKAEAMHGAEIIAITQNETSTGVSVTPSFIGEIRKKNPEALIVIDAVSSLPYPEIDFSVVDSVFFSVQKGFGLPAGLGVWIVNQKCIDKAEYLLQKGMSIGSYHSLPTLLSNARKNQTPETPNVLGIYLLGKVTEDFNRKGLVSIRQETEYKSATLYKALESQGVMKPFVAHSAHRSKTVIVADCGSHTADLTTFLQARGLSPGEGYGEFKKSHLRFANFPAHSEEAFESLADAFNEFTSGV